MDFVNNEEVFDTRADLSGETETVFAAAKKEYLELTEMLSNTVFPARVEFEKFFENTEFSIEQGLADLDIILQYSLLELDFKNGHVRDEVVEAIEGICKHGSIVKEFCSRDEYFNWTCFTDMKNEQVGGLLDSLNVYISKVSRDFSSFLRLHQPEEGRGFILNVAQKMNDIINIIYYQNIKLSGNPFRSACLANAIFRQLVA